MLIVLYDISSEMFALESINEFIQKCKTKIRKKTCRSAIKIVAASIFMASEGWGSMCW